MVAFSGGEPFLLGTQLVKAVHEANSHGFVTRVVTSAFFGKQPTIAEKRLLELREVGLKELSISWDDFHASFVSFDCIYNTFWAAKSLGINVAVNVVQANNCQWTAERVRKELGLQSKPDEKIQGSPLNITGRAQFKLKDSVLLPIRLLGPCPYILTGPTLSAKNKLLACCGVIPETKSLILDSKFRPENMEQAIKKALQSTLFNWLYLRGPYAIMEWISDRYNISIMSKDTISGNCEACQLLFSNKEIAERIPNALKEKATEIASELHVLDALGWLEPEVFMRLWCKEYHQDLSVQPAQNENNREDGHNSALKNFCS